MNSFGLIIAVLQVTSSMMMEGRGDSMTDVERETDVDDDSSHVIQFKQSSAQNYVEPHIQISPPQFLRLITQRQNHGDDEVFLQNDRVTVGATASLWPRGRELQGGGDRPRRHDVSVAQGSQQDYRRPQYATARPVVRPDKFDGTEDWPTYLQHFEWCAEMNGWSDLEKARYLAVSMTGNARQVLATAHKEVILDYQAVVCTLQSRFDYSAKIELDRIQLKNRVRQKGESLYTLGDDIRRLIDRVFKDIPRTARDKLARDSFIDALTDSDVRLRVLQMRTRNLQEAMEAAYEIETIKHAWSTN